jgi:hypothetical protein
MRRLTDFVWVIVDLVFPCPQPRHRDDIIREREHTAAAQGGYEQIITGLPSNDEHLREYLSSCQGLLATEHERRQGVDARLTTIVGLSSIAGTIVLGSMLAQPPSLRYGLPGWVLALGPLYLTLQACSAILAAVLGLGRRGYRAITPTDVLPEQNEAPGVQLRRQITNCLHVLDDDRINNNEKVTHMAVAHRAMLNFLGGLLGLAILGTWHTITASPRDELMERLHQDHTLRELLRGPQGPQGNPGLQGQPGTPCVNNPPRSKHP